MGLWSDEKANQFYENRIKKKKGLDNNIIEQKSTPNKCWEKDVKRQKMKYATYDIDVLMWARVILQFP